MFFDNKYRQLMNSDEERLIDRCLPWTYMWNAQVEIDKHIINNKDKFVIKPVMGSSGENVTLGWKTTESEWMEVLQNISNKGENYIIQERVKSAIIEVPKIQGSKMKIINNWGFYIFNDEFGGILNRYLDIQCHDEIISGLRAAGFASVFIKR